MLSRLTTADTEIVRLRDGRQPSGIRSLSEHRSEYRRRVESVHFWQALPETPWHSYSVDSTPERAANKTYPARQGRNRGLALDRRRTSGNSRWQPATYRLWTRLVFLER